MFDVAEFFTGSYIADLPYKTLGLTAIPVFVKRMFRHSYIYINKRRGISTPADLNGKRVGIQNWITSAALWARGILEEDYGVDLDRSHVALRPELCRLDAAIVAETRSCAGRNRPVRAAGFRSDRCRHFDRNLGAPQASRHRFPVSGLREA
jgi:hypothetical protein